MVIARSCGPGTLYGDAPFDFENWSLDALIKLAAEAEKLTKPPSEGLVDPTSEPPKFRAWLEAHHEKLDSDHIAFVNSLKQESKLAEWAAALLAELRRRQPPTGTTETIDQAAEQVQSLLER
jgi:hypothetical protein